MKPRNRSRLHRGPLRASAEAKILFGVYKLPAEKGSVAFLENLESKETTRYDVSVKGPSLCACCTTRSKMIMRSSSGRRNRGEAVSRVIGEGQLVACGCAYHSGCMRTGDIGGHGCRGDETASWAKFRRMKPRVLSSAQTADTSFECRERRFQPRTSHFYALGTAREPARVIGSRLVFITSFRSFRVKSAKVRFRHRHSVSPCESIGCIPESFYNKSAAPRIRRLVVVIGNVSRGVLALTSSSRFLQSQICRLSSSRLALSRVQTKEPCDRSKTNCVISVVSDKSLTRVGMPGNVRQNLVVVQIGCGSSSSFFS